MNELLGFKYGSIIAGFFGGVVYIFMVENKLTKLQILSSLAVGVLCAGYLTPLITAYIKFSWKTDLSPETSGGIAFLIGLCAITTIPIFLRRVQAVIGGKKSIDGDKP
ncbi:MAG: hypothetical protein WC967_09205 [Balneolaceae bacterium]